MRLRAILGAQNKLIENLIEENEVEVKSIAEKARKTLKSIGLDNKYCRVNTESHHDGSGHIEKDQLGNLHWIITERGSVIKDEKTDSEYEILFLIYENATHEYAITWESMNRKINQDFRILMFTKHLDLLNLIDSRYMERQLVKYKAIMSNFEYKSLAQ